jgi:heptaprenyl diphosphate synthase
VQGLSRSNREASRLSSEQNAADAATALTDDELETALDSLSADSPLNDGCRYIIAGRSKRIRSTILIGAAQFGSRSDSPLVRQSAVAVELFHAATLAHDDVVDDGQLRRGKPAVGAQSGNLTAGFAGGWLFTRAIELIADVGDEAPARLAATASMLCEGEMLEIRDLHNVDRTLDRYLVAIGAKTASLFSFAAWLGATAGDVPRGEVDQLADFGEAVGIAFQIADDIMDLVADDAATGKTPGNDLRQGVYTLPVLYALQRDPSLRDALLHEPEAKELPLIVNRICQTGVLEAAFTYCTRWIERAHSLLPRSMSNSGQEVWLGQLADSVLSSARGAVKS